MKPGRELDALVAEKVMGWKDLHEHDFGNGGKQWRGTRSDGTEMVPMLDYSTDIAAAWRVVEKLEDDMNVFRNFHPGNEEEKWENSTHYHASFRMCDDFSCDEICATAPTAPHAICLAALKALGVEV